MYIDMHSHTHIHVYREDRKKNEVNKKHRIEFDHNFVLFFFDIMKRD